MTSHERRLALARRRLREEAKSPAAQVAIETPGIGGKPIPLTFPLAGLATKIDKLSARCANSTSR